MTRSLGPKTAPGLFVVLPNMEGTCGSLPALPTWTGSYRSTHLCRISAMVEATPSQDCAAVGSTRLDWKPFAFFHVLPVQQTPTTQTSKNAPTTASVLHCPAFSTRSACTLCLERHELIDGVGDGLHLAGTEYYCNTMVSLLRVLRNDNNYRASRACRQEGPTWRPFIRTAADWVLVI